VNLGTREAAREFPIVRELTLSARPTNLNFPRLSVGRFAAPSATAPASHTRSVLGKAALQAGQKKSKNFAFSAFQFFEYHFCVLKN
jgi:hypothetical protein